jgi:nitroreductase
MPDLDVFEAMQTARAVRRLRTDPVPDDLLRKVLTAATWAPNGGNAQPWRFLAVRDAALRRELGRMYLGLWNSFRDAYSAKRLGSLEGDARAKAQRMLDSADHLANHFHEAPVIVVPCVEIAHLAITDAALDRPSLVGGATIYPAVENLLLACRAVGLGVTLTTILCAKEPEVRALLSVPEGWATCAHLPIGWPAGKGFGPVRRRPIEQVAYLDRWAKPLFA